MIHKSSEWLVAQIRQVPFRPSSREHTFPVAGIENTDLIKPNMWNLFRNTNPILFLCSMFWVASLRHSRKLFFQNSKSAAADFRQAGQKRSARLPEPVSRALCFTPRFSIQIIYMPFPQFRYCADAKADNHDIVNGESTESRQTCPRIFETCSLEQNISGSDHATNPVESN